MLTFKIYIDSSAERRHPVSTTTGHPEFTSSKIMHCRGRSTETKINSTALQAVEIIRLFHWSEFHWVAAMSWGKRGFPFRTRSFFLSERSFLSLSSFAVCVTANLLYWRISISLCLRVLDCWKWQSRMITKLCSSESNHTLPICSIILLSLLSDSPNILFDTPTDNGFF